MDYFSLRMVEKKNKIFRIDTIDIDDNVIYTLKLNMFKTF